MTTAYRTAPDACLHKGMTYIDWMTPALGKPRRPDVMWIERCLECGHEKDVPFPAKEPTLWERLVAWWSGER